MLVQADGVHAPRQVGGDEGRLRQAQVLQGRGVSKTEDEVVEELRTREMFMAENTGVSI